MVLRKELSSAGIPMFFREAQLGAPNWEFPFTPAARGDRREREREKKKKREILVDYVDFISLRRWEVALDLLTTMKGPGLGPFILGCGKLILDSFGQDRR